MQPNSKKIFLSVWTVFAVLIPFLAAQPVWAAEELIPLGKTVGVTLETDGLLVLGSDAVVGEDGKSHEPTRGILRVGDRILQVNGQPAENKEMLAEAIQGSGGKPLTLLFTRDGKQRRAQVTPIFSAADGTFVLGIWIRDSIQGIGTMTYYNPNTKHFGALGHGIYDADTEERLAIRDGFLAEAKLCEILRGEKGSAGALIGQVENGEKLATILRNDETGIYGKAETAFAGESYPIATKAEVREGEAVLLSDLAGDGITAYTLCIEQIDRNAAQKQLTLRITDERLLALTGGIVQGMSGAPILQEGRLIGAVTHVMLRDPARGYGILIETMLAAEQEAAA